MVLIVDDHEPNRFALGSVLRRAGHLVRTAATGAEALDVLHAGAAPPDLVVIDVRLPDMSGFELAQRIATDSTLPRIPVVHMSAEADDTSARVKALNEGASAYLSAPVEPEELLATTRAVLRAAGEVKAAVNERIFAMELQRAFLPREEKMASLEGIEVGYGYLPAMHHAEIGGDFYAAFTTESGVLLAVGDVSGHSLAAATVMVELRHALRAYSLEGHALHHVLAWLDRLLDRYHPEVTATLCLTELDPWTGTLTVANGGHLPPLIVSPDGRAEYLEVHGPLLGLNLPHPPATATRLEYGQVLLMVTDGLIERPGTDLADSLEELRQRAMDCPCTPHALRDTLLQRYSSQATDDIAILAVRRQPNETT